jgi:predicted transcriptional regulator
MKFNITRAKVLYLISKHQSVNVSDLVKFMDISSGSIIYMYLDEPKKAGLIEYKKESKKRGQPTLVSNTSKVDLIDFDNLK